MLMPSHFIVLPIMEMPSVLFTLLRLTGSFLVSCWANAVELSNNAISNNALVFIGIMIVCCFDY
jgi:hypothetical protein